MTDEPITVSVWEPTDQQRRAVQMRGHGHTYQRVADALQVHITTVQRWFHDHPELNEMVEDVQEELRDTQEPQFQRSIDLAQQILLGALAGEYKADDPRVLLAERVLARTLHRVIAIQARGSGRNVPTDPPGLSLPAGGDAA